MSKHTQKYVSNSIGIWEKERDKVVKRARARHKQIKAQQILSSKQCVDYISLYLFIWLARCCCCISFCAHDSNRSKRFIPNPIPFSSTLYNMHASQYHYASIWLTLNFHFAVDVWHFFLSSSSVLLFSVYFHHRYIHWKNVAFLDSCLTILSLC